MSRNSRAFFSQSQVNNPAWSLIRVIDQTEATNPEHKATMSAPKAAQNEGFKRFVQVGRVVYLTSGPYATKLATIVEIIDHNRALIDGPSTGVVRHVCSYATLTLTPYIVTGLPRASGSPTVAKFWTKSGVQEKWDASAWAKKLAGRKRRSELSDFERFSVMRLKKERRYAVQKAVAKA